MKAKIHIATGQYEFTEVEVNGTLQEIKDKEQELRDLYNHKVGDGLEVKEWNQVLEKYCVTKKMTSDEYERMNEKQQFTIQELKKCFKRLVDKRDKELANDANAMCANDKI